MKNQKEIYTPSSLLAIFRNAINVREEKKLIYIEGFYHKTGSKNYNGFYYDKISDSTNQFLTVKVTNEVRESLDDGDVYSFFGHIERRIKPNGTIDITFVSSINQIPELIKKSVMDNIKRESELIKEKSQKPYFNIDHYIKSKLKKNIHPTISLISGLSSSVLPDFFNALGDQKEKFDFDKPQINLTSKDAIINALSDITLNSSDIVVFIRGGGEGLEIFNDYHIVKKAMNIDPYIISAIGHAENSTLFDSVADKKFDTPTAFGNYLYEISKKSHNIDLKKIVNYILYIGIGLIIGLIVSKYLF
ncbi:MAG: hypothetical protein HQ534_04420 [Armatimonadetes bacterium]|nr:hypothetical protein [Armatimonadota bacterium]